MSSNQRTIRALVRGTYDLQKLRIEQGNRLVANFRAKLGLDPNEAPEEKPVALLDLERRFKLITDGIVEVTRRRKYLYDGVISDYTELCLVYQYVDLVIREKKHFRQMASIIEEHPLWDAFFEGVRGCGPAMSGVILSEIDIHKAMYVSSLWKYSGLDVVSYWKLDRIRQEKHWKHKNRLPAFSADLVPDERHRLWKNGEVHEVVIGRDYGHYHMALIDDEGTTNITNTVLAYIDGNLKMLTYRLCYRPTMVKSGRSRRAEHLVDVEYEAKDGTRKTRKSITFNPFLKTKLMGVLASSILRAGDSPLRDVYDRYKHRLQNRPDLSEASKGHIHNMSMRYMIKRFLAELYVAWRTLEGLPVHETYEEAKLGIKHGQENE